MKTTAYDVITEAFITQLEAGTIPWQRPWKVDGVAPTNLISKKAYRGINIWILAPQPYSSPYWLTYKQAASLKGNVKKGEKGTRIVFWKLSKYSKEENGEKTERTSFILNYYTVFNLEQTEGIDVSKIPVNDHQELEHDPIETAEQVVSGMPHAPEITYKGGQACYTPFFDKVTIPELKHFTTPEGFYSTTFHELAHSTGHSSRLNRFEDNEADHRFGSESYSKEELVAEMTASFLCGYCDILDVTFDNSAAYLKSWLKALKEDSKLIVHAAAAAQKASDYILNIKHEKD